MNQHKLVCRLISTVLSLVLVISMIPATVYAKNSWGGTGVAEVQKDPDSNTGLCAMGNNLVLKDGSNGGLTGVYYADASGSIVGGPIDLSAMSLEITGDSAGGFDLKDIRLWGTYTGSYNSDANAFDDMDVGIWMEGGTLSEIMTGNGSTAVCRSITVYMSGGTLTGENSTFNSAITADATYVSGGRIEQNLTAQFPRYLSGSPNIGGEGCGITVKSGEKFYLNGELSGGSVYVVPKADFTDGTVIAEGVGYQITENDISRLHLTGDYAAGKELYLENNAVKIRTAQTAVEQDPYEIGTAAQLIAFAERVNSGETGDNAVLTADIDMNGQNWTGIARSGAFTGVFDGKGYTISNLTGTEGLFANNSGTIQNVRLENVKIQREGGNLGAVAGVNTGTVFNCVSSGTITGTGSEAYSIGGLIGHNNGGTLCGSASSCNVGGKTAGGLTGSNWYGNNTNNSKIIACIYTGNAAKPVEADNTYSTCDEVYYRDANGEWKSYPNHRTADENELLQRINNYIAENGGAFNLSGDGTAYPAGAVSYLDYTENGFVTRYIETYTEIKGETVPAEWTNGWYVVDGEVAINNRVTVSGDVKLILKNGAKLIVNGGIDISSPSNSFTVYAQSNNESIMGSLTATAATGTGNAGIGSGGGRTAGAITINGGKITATGGAHSENRESVIPGEWEEIVYTGAGIGGGEKSGCSRITINGGVVAAEPGRGTDFRETCNSAAIGNGGQNRMDFWYDETPVGTIVINGGSVNATGVYWGAGIGGGDDMPIASVTINGGIVNAESDDSAGIGNGGAGGGGTITITGGTVNAVSQYACGIGGGYISDIESVVITGGDITAISDYGAGIGSCAYRTTAEVMISGGRVTASSNKGDGIGRGDIFRDDLVDFSTGTDGHAVIFASSIADQTGKDAWSGLIFEDGEGKIYGERYTIDKELTIPEDQTLTIESNKSLIVESGVVLTNKGAIHLNEDGIYSGAAPQENPIACQIQWDTDGDGMMDDTTYVKIGEKPTHEDGIKEKDAQYTYTFIGWSPEISVVDGTEAYTAQFSKSVNQYTVTLPTGEGYVVTASGMNKVDYGTDFTFTVAVTEGYSTTGEFAVKANGELLQAQPDGSYKVNVKADTDITVEGIADITAPSGDIKIQEDSIKKALHNITFGLFFKENVEISITAEDAGSGVKSIQYYRSKDILTEAQVKEISDWEDYKTAITETAEDAAGFVYYVKITDHAGNSTCFGSDGVTFDLSAPVISGITDGATYYTTQQVIVSDTNLESVTQNGNTVGETFALEGNQTTEYIITATDKAENRTIYTVAMKSIDSLDDSIESITIDNVTSVNKAEIEKVKTAVESVDQTTATEEEKGKLQAILDNCESLLTKIEESAQAGNTGNTDKVEDITAENVKPEDKEDLIAAKEDLENALQNFGDNYTEEEKAVLEEKLEQINQALESIEKVEAVQDAIAALPDMAEPDDADTSALINAAKEQYDQLTEHEKSLIPEKMKEKLEGLLGDLLDYRIIAGNGSQWTVGEDGTITITANGPIEKFTGIEVDGKAVDAGNYTIKSGSTIITLKPEYLNTLSVGKHILTVIYTDGEVSGEFEIVKESETSTLGNDAPETGDNSNLALWLGLMIAAGCGLSGIMTYNRKKKQEK